jgi:hypothetical protein
MTKVSIHPTGPSFSFLLGIEGGGALHFWGIFFGYSQCVPPTCSNSHCYLSSTLVSSPKHETTIPIFILGRPKLDYFFCDEPIKDSHHKKGGPSNVFKKKHKNYGVVTNEVIFLIGSKCKMRAPNKAMLTKRPLPCRYCECGTHIYTYFRVVGSYFLLHTLQQTWNQCFLNFFSNFVMYQEWPINF